MGVRFVSQDENIKGFLQMAHLLSFLETAEYKEQKVRALKAARQTGLITEDEALELAIEYC